MFRRGGRECAVSELCRIGVDSTNVGQPCQTSTDVPCNTHQLTANQQIGLLLVHHTINPCYRVDHRGLPSETTEANAKTSPDRLRRLHLPLHPLRCSLGRLQPPVHINNVYQALPGSHLRVGQWRRLCRLDYFSVYYALAAHSGHRTVRVI